MMTSLGNIFGCQPKLTYQMHGTGVKSVQLIGSSLCGGAKGLSLGRGTKSLPTVIVTWAKFIRQENRVLAKRGSVTPKMQENKEKGHWSQQYI